MTGQPGARSAVEAGAAPALAADVPYHRLARTETQGGLPVLGTLLVLVGVALVVVVSGVLYALNLPPVWTQATTNLALGGFILVVFLAARWVQRRPAGSVSSVTGRIRWRWLMICSGWAVLAVVTGLVVGGTVLILLSSPGDAGQAADDSMRWVGWLPFLVATGSMLVTVPFQAAGEEYLARGWMVQFFGSYLRTPWVGIVAGGLFWTLLHVPSTPWAFGVLMLWSVVLGLLVIRTGGLEAAIAFHVVNNLWVFVFAAAFTGVDGAGNAGASPWETLVVDAITLPLFAWLVLASARRSGVARVGRPAVATPPEPVPGPA
ncbi:CPBP family glutamic-type intramembrane protease [Pseudonocardia bannensis]